MRNRHVVVVLVVGVLGASTVPAPAENLVSGDVGLGWGGGVPDATSWRLALSGLKDSLFFGLRATGVEEFEILGPSPPESARDYGLLVGFGSNDHDTLRYAAVGLGVARGVWREGRGTGFFGGRHERREETAVGACLELGAMRHGERFGIGVAAFGNLNGAQSYLALAMTVHVGRLR